MKLLFLKYFMWPLWLKELILSNTVTRSKFIKEYEKYEIVWIHTRNCKGENIFLLILSSHSLKKLNFAFRNSPNLYQIQFFPVQLVIFCRFATFFLFLPVRWLSYRTASCKHIISNGREIMYEKKYEHNVGFFMRNDVFEGLRVFER